MSHGSSQPPRSGRSLRRQIESIQRKRIAGQKVVKLGDYRDLQKQVKSPTILVVDDDEVMRNALKRILESEGYHIVMAEDAMELSKVLENTWLDLILLDVNLPWVNGIELCQLIKSHQSLKAVPLILISGRKSPEDIESGLQAGADDFLSKPFDLDQMTAAVSQALEKKAK
ncbi:MAG: response regulator [Oligoflexus sp.]